MPALRSSTNTRIMKRSNESSRTGWAGTRCGGWDTNGCPIIGIWCCAPRGQGRDESLPALGHGHAYHAISCPLSYVRRRTSPSGPLQEFPDPGRRPLPHRLPVCRTSKPTVDCLQLPGESSKMRQVNHATAPAAASVAPAMPLRSFTSVKWASGGALWNASRASLRSEYRCKHIAQSPLSQKMAL